MERALIISSGVAREANEDHLANIKHTRLALLWLRNKKADQLTSRTMRGRRTRTLFGLEWRPEVAQRRRSAGINTLIDYFM